MTSVPKDPSERAQNQKQHLNQCLPRPARGVNGTGTGAASGHDRQPSESQIAAAEAQPPVGPHVETQPEVMMAVTDDGDDDEDEFDPEEMDSISDASTSLPSFIWDHEFVNGRRYHRYRNGRYPLPNDDQEQTREAMKHGIHLESCDGQLFQAPIGDHPQRILDLGTGIGVWAIEVADRFPSAIVTGLDLSPIQPSWVPPNVRFLVDDIEDEWIETEPYDFVHMRHCCPYIKDVEKLLKNCHDHLKPGGWCEFSDFGGFALSDDDSMPDDYALNECMLMMRRAVALRGCNSLVANEHEDNFRRAGFKNIRCRVVKTPVGPWPKDKKQRLIGAYTQEITHGLATALGLKLFKTLMSEVEIEVFLARVHESINDTRIHSYFNFITWWGQRVD